MTGIDQMRVCPKAAMRRMLLAVAVICPCVSGVAGPALATSDGATATIKLANGSDAGTVTFTAGTAGVLLKFDLKGLPPGPHAVHVYETGTCEGDFESAGGIYNPLGARHGFLAEEGPMAGDLPNIHVGADGTAIAEMLTPFLTLSTDSDESLFDADGAALVILANGDDYETEPDGGAGARLGCGVITLTK
jgi:Cu-Zn family superoxide dismutase